ncbi:putative Peroxidase 48 [Euphorbia lathyris]|uniref:putative Peroxidase 48 n=1 Tax=Euphorbia lathyris TaxID=212925 RepID=UPI003313B597
MESKRWMYTVMITFPVLLSLMKSNVELEEEMDFSVFLQRDGIHGISLAFRDLEYDYYRQTCPEAESIVRETVAIVFAQQKDVYAAFLRLFFHDCFTEGCDASIFLDDSYGNKNYSIERQAIPNLTLRGIDKIDIIKEELENVCPGVVSCADTLALATRDAILLAGGPFYPVFTGRRDSTQSYYDKAMTVIPSPFDNINRILELFSFKGFDERETVSLLGGHNVGKMSCDFIRSRLFNFSGTGKPDVSMASDFINQIRLGCQENKKTIDDDEFPTHMTSKIMKKSTKGNLFSQFQSLSIPSGEAFDAHFYRNLLRGRGLLFADQQLMADEKTARFVRVYASDDGTIFRRDFAKAMVKMSNLGVLTGNLGQVRTKCSLPAI